MRLILFRHGPASRRDPARWPDDTKRTLTRRGRERTYLAAVGLRRLLGRTGRIVTSPLVRAAQTAEVMVEAQVSDQRVETLEALAPGAPHREVLHWLRGIETGSCVILVGHEPHLGRLAGLLVLDSPTANLPLKKASAMLIDFVGKVEPGGGRLTAYLPPRVMRRLGRSGVRT